MNTINQNSHTEGSDTYELGTIQGNQIIYDFEKILICLNAKGKLLFKKPLNRFDEDRDIVFRFCNYIIKDESNWEKLDIDIHKGILLMGSVGFGITSLMKLRRHMVPHQKPYKMIPTRNIIFGFKHLGYKTIEDYGSTNYFCFDDLGVEPIGRHYGKDCNVMGEILLSRYELFLYHKVKTHATSNLNAQELEERYGNRVRSRMRQLFNLIAFEPNTVDKRK